jgi:HK97 family phage major capsid protein
MSKMLDLLRDNKRSTGDRADLILTRAERENRKLSKSEESELREIHADLATIETQIDRRVDDEIAERSTERAMSTLMGSSSGPTYSTSDERDLNEKFRRVILTRSNEPIDVRTHDRELRSGFQPGIEQRDLATTTGGGMVPTVFSNRVLSHLVDNSAIMAAGATVLQTTSGEPLRIPRSTALSTAQIVTEAGLIPEADPTLGTVTLGAYKYGFLVQVTTELAEDANFDLLGFLAEQAGVAIGNAFGAHAINGTGTGQPTGALTGATLGVTGPTGTATSLGSQTTVGQGGDLLIDLAGSLAEPYARSSSAAWLMRNATLSAVRKLRDSTGQYVFSTDIIPGSGSAGTILGRPVYTDPNMPAMGAGNKSILFGDLSRYFVRQVNGLRFERSDDFAFANDLVTFRALARMDGALIDTSGALKYFQHSAT